MSKQKAFTTRQQSHLFFFYLVAKSEGFNEGELFSQLQACEDGRWGEFVDGRTVNSFVGRGFFRGVTTTANKSEVGSSVKFKARFFFDVYDEAERVVNEYSAKGYGFFEDAKSVADDMLFSPIIPDPNGRKYVDPLSVFALALSMNEPNIGWLTLAVAVTMVAKTGVKSFLVDPFGFQVQFKAPKIHAPTAEEAPSDEPTAEPKPDAPSPNEPRLAVVLKPVAVLAFELVNLDPLTKLERLGEFGRLVTATVARLKAFVEAPSPEAEALALVVDATKAVNKVERMTTAVSLGGSKQANYLADMVAELTAKAEEAVGKLEPSQDGRSFNWSVQRRPSGSLKDAVVIVGREHGSSFETTVGRVVFFKNVNRRTLLEFGKDFGLVADGRPAPTTAVKAPSTAEDRMTQEEVDAWREMERRSILRVTPK